MNAIAQTLIRCLEFAFADDSSLQDAEDEVWTMLRGLSPAERKALSAAASVRLAELLRPPDEHGYTPRSLVDEEHKQLLESLASGEAFESDGDEEDDDEAE